jgi:hypothetical protein
VGVSASPQVEGRRVVDSQNTLPVGAVFALAGSLDNAIRLREGGYMKVFLSWSGETSHRLAKTLHDWLPYVIQAVKPFISSGDIEKGKHWSNVLADKLQDTAYRIICITRYNLNSAWLHFEAWAISKAIDQSSISLFLLRVDPTEMRGPLSQFQSIVCNRNDIYKLMYSINSRLEPERQLTIDVLERTFDKWWPELEKIRQRL